MNCDVIRDLLPLYADGLTSPTTNQLIEEHLAACTECSAILEDLCLPIESPPPEDAGDKLIKALHRQKRRNRAITISICILVSLAILLTWWVHMETRFKTVFTRIDSTDPAIILEEKPQVKVTEDEIALSEILFTHPIILEAFAELKPNTATPECTQLSSALLDEILIKHLPEGTKVSEILLFYNLIVLDYRCSGTRIILTISDSDNTGHVDIIGKTVGTLEENGEVKHVYSSIYNIATKESQYEKMSSHHKWFGFLE